MIEIPQPERPVATRIARDVGTALIVTAFALPFLAALAGYISLAGAAYDTAKNAGLLICFGLLAWFAAQRRHKTAWAYACLLAGLVLSLFSASNLVQPIRETDARKQFVIAVVAHHARQTAAFTELGDRFQKADVSRILTPENISTREGLSIAKTGIASYRSLVTERRVLMQTQLIESDRFINQRLAPGIARDIGVMQMNEGRTALVKMYSDMDLADTQLLDAMSALVDWGVAQEGRLGMHRGSFVFESDAQKLQLQRLVAAVEKADAARDAIVSVNTVGQARAEQRQTKNAAGAEEFLKNRADKSNPANFPPKR